MPVVPPVVIPQQVQPNAGVLPFVQQQNFGQLIGEIASYNPNSLAQIPGWINSELRSLLDLKTWYGTWVKGQILCPNAVTGGQATVTFNSNIVQGTNTSWSQTLVGWQFRIGLNAPLYTITNVDFAEQQLTLELPWGGPLPPNQTTQTAGYTIAKAYYSLGPNIKYIKVMANLQLGFKLRLNMTQDYFYNVDTWRIYENFPWAAAPLPTDPNGNYLIELWPLPITAQCMPFLAYTQPANLAKDSDSLPPYIRSDVIARKCIARALRYKPKDNPGYDPQTALQIANEFERQYKEDVQAMANADENLYRTSMTIPGEDLPFYTPGGNLWAATHACLADSRGGDEGW